MGPPSLFVAATRQHTGKTSAALGIVSGLQYLLNAAQPPLRPSRHGAAGAPDAPLGVGFMKPVGQKSVRVREGSRHFGVDKDVPLFKELLGCAGAYSEMSPVLVGKGYTRKYLQGKISAADELARIRRSFEAIAHKSDLVVVEGTGHVAVGACVGLSNARVAAHLNAPMVLVLNGGIGSTLDEFVLNAQLCHAEGARIGGVILNKINPSKLRDVEKFTVDALERVHGVPVLGCVPDFEFLSRLAVLDFENVGLSLLVGHEHRCSHRDVETVLTGPAEFSRKILADRLASRRTLYAIHSSRADLLGTLRASLEDDGAGGAAAQSGVILVENTTAAPSVWEPFRRFGVPVLSTPDTLEAMTMRLQEYTAKLNVSDRERTSAVTDHYAQHIDFDALLGVVLRQTSRAAMTPAVVAAQAHARDRARRASGAN